MTTVNLMGERLRRARLSMDLTQKDFALKLGVSDKTVSAWENGTKAPRRRTMMAIAQITGKTVDYFYGSRTSFVYDKPRTADNLGESVYHRFFSRNDAVSKAFKEFANTLMQEEQRKLSSADNKLLEKYSQLNKSNQQAVMMMIESLLAQQKASSIEGEGS